MFSLIITLISIGLVAALALATLYYGGEAFQSGRAKAEAAKLTNQGQQLIAAAEFYYVQRGHWPDSVADMVSSGYLSSAPVAQRPLLQEALASDAWQMPTARQPLFAFNDVQVDVCREVNESSYGLNGVLPDMYEGYVQQCFGPTSTDLVVVAARGSVSQLVATVEDGLLVSENVALAPVPDAEDTGAWTVAPGSTVAKGAEALPEPPPPGALGLSPSLVDFGAVATHTSSNQDVVLSNDSATTFSLGAPTLQGDGTFTIYQTTCGASLAPGASCAVTVRYSPTVVSSGQGATLVVAEGASASLQASAFNPVSMQSSVLPAAKLNRVYTPKSFADYLTVSNEASPDLGQVAWEAQGQLPQGMSFDGSTGTLSGTPTALTDPEGQAFTVLATYKNNQGQQVYILQVGEAVLTATQIEAGNNHTCAVTDSGGAKCWGLNSAGQLGNGTTTNSATPVAVLGLESGVASISAGSAHSCAVLTNGAAVCWGENTNGQLGDGSTISRTVPVAVAGLGSGVASISVGGYVGGAHTCAVTSGGAAKCWGWNSSGQLGDGTSTNRSTPVDVAGLGAGVTSLSAGGYHTCAVSGSAAKCWGNGSSGQLGDGATGSRNVPATAVGLSSGVASLSTGAMHSCAVLTNGAAKCWGGNVSGELGDGTTTDRSSPGDVAGLGTGVTSVSAGASHTCAVSAGAAKCWGNGSSGRLGDGTTSSRSTPVTVSGLGAGVVNIVAGFAHSCAVSTSVGTKCWGDNSYGKVGDGTGASGSRPTPVTVVD